MLKILDASPGYGEPLSEQDTKDFLTTKVLNIHLGTVDENGHANIHPAWYYYDSSKEKIYVETGKHSKKMEIYQGIIRFTFVSTIQILLIKAYVVKGVQWYMKT